MTSSVGPSRRCIWIPDHDQRDCQPIISVIMRMGFDRSIYRAVANAECTRECIHLGNFYNPQLWPYAHRTLSSQRMEAGIFQGASVAQSPSSLNDIFCSRPSLYIHQSPAGSRSHWRSKNI
ncbi:hypothetical protein CY34DRAFT_813064 [Suillus luteus UH-Slu-Lm8-n1]|uniref:Uncharacterized protein n=1 Tax=Suillus luteus UH-Slu-Lm8-n1 TaxID=930992 RepID=A0A0D0AIY2_9AGAM|nr:hypothetical protein CY34DRAFT_813064 [Suillus luteus UH-Slu-Lm8-n1]